MIKTIKDFFSKQQNEKNNIKREGSPLNFYGNYSYKNYLWPKDPDILKLYENFFGEESEVIKDRHYNLYQLSKLSKHISGDTVECGVRHGFGSYLMIHAVSDKNKIHHCFDSFEGLSKPKNIDINPDGTYQWEKGDLAVSLDKVKANFKEVHINNVKFYKGWIPERFDELSSEKFSLLHIDVDLHDPTLDSLHFFYNRMNKGGIIICDDYGSTSCPGAKKAFDDFFSDKKEEIISLTTSQAFIVKN